MEKNSSQSCSCSKKSCGFSFSGILSAGFFAAILTNIIMVAQGNNVLLYFGSLFFGTEGDPKMLYLAGIIMAVVLGIIFTFFYAIILAPLRFINNLVKAIIFAVLLTVIGYYVTPQLPSLIDRLVSYSSFSRDHTVAPIEPANSQSILESIAEKKISKALVISFTNSLIFSLMVVVLYRGRKCCGS